MFRLISRITRPGKKRHNNSTRPQERCKVAPSEEKRQVAAGLEQNKKIVHEVFDRCADLVVREFLIGRVNPVRAMAVFLDPLVNRDLMSEFLAHPLMEVDRVPPAGVTLDWLKERVVTAGSILEKRRWVEAGNGIAKGLVALFVDGQSRVILLDIPEATSRAISQPISEQTLRGSADAFNEDRRTNLALLRKRLRSTRLAVENLELGTVTKNVVSIVYLKGYANGGLVDEVKTRLRRIEIDGILNSEQVTEFIQDSPYSLFSGVGTTERPDIIAANLLEGRVGLILGNTPYALFVPATLGVFMQTPDDYSNRYWYGSFIRLLRWAGLFIALLMPGFYIAVLSFHQEMVPTVLFTTIMADREGVPFPIFVEALIMELAFEMLREAGVRLPRPFGQTISIVGAIVIGQAAVSARLVSTGMVVVVALTAVASYTVATIPLASVVRLLRFIFMFAGSGFGLFGVTAAMSLLTFHLCALRSFGVPYLSPAAPLSPDILRDTLVRVPVWMMRRRPRFLNPKDPVRQPAGHKPHPPAGRISGRRRKKGGR
jgi:spore germination protein KA